MTLVSDIIRDAYRESNLIAVGTEPSGAQTDEALRLLQRIVASVYGDEEGEELEPLPIGSNDINRPSGYPWYNQVPSESNWFVPKNTRLVLNLTAPQELWLAPCPEDGDRFAIQDISRNLSTFNVTINGNGRTIGGATSAVFDTDGSNVEYMFRADLGDWVAITPITAVDLFPFPIDFDDMFVTMLAMRLNPRYVVATDPATASAYRRSSIQFKARYRQHQEVGSELGLVMTPGNKRCWNGWGYGVDDSLFRSGQAFPWRFKW